MSINDYINFLYRGFIHCCQRKSSLHESFKIMWLFLDCWFTGHLEDFVDVCSENLVFGLKDIRPLPKVDDLQDFAIILCWNRSCTLWFCPNTRLTTVKEGSEALIRHWEWKIASGDLEVVEIDPLIVQDILNPE